MLVLYEHIQIFMLVSNSTLQLLQVWLITFDHQILLKKAQHIHHKLTAADLTIEAENFQTLKDKVYTYWWLNIQKKDLKEIFTFPFTRQSREVDITVYLLEKNLDNQVKQIIAHKSNSEF